MLNRPLMRLVKLEDLSVIRRFLSLLIICALFSFVPATAQERSAEETVQEGYVYLDRGDYAFAQYLFQEVLEQDENNVGALIGKGRALVRQNAFVTGIEEINKARALEPNNVDAAVQLAIAYQRQFQSDPAAHQGRLSEALAVLEQAEAQAPNDPEVLSAKGAILFFQDNAEAARAAFEQAVALADEAELSDADLSQLHENLGGAYRRLGQLEQALQSFRRSVAFNPTNASAHNNVGDIHYKLGNCDDAIYEFTQATRLAPSAADAKSNLAITLFECGDVSGSLEHFEAALELPGSLNLPPLYTYASRAYVELGRLDEAVRRAQQGALLPPVTAEAYYYLGQAYEARAAEGDASRAREAYQSALELDASFEDAQEALNGL